MSDDDALVERRLSGEQVWRGHFLDVRRDVIVQHDGHTALREYIVHPGAVMVVPLLDDGRLVMERQFRYTDIHDKIASKIAYESMFLGGSLPLYMNVRDAMKRTGVDELIEMDFAHALQDRKNAMRTLLDNRSGELDDETRSLFYFSQERVEFT